jgi:hypothetical protein
MPKKPYKPMASYEALSEVEQMINGADLDALKVLVKTKGPKIGYKAFCYMLGGKMTAAAMKPDEACIEAAKLEQAGNAEDALAIYKEVVAVHPDHPIAEAKVQ